jgi:RNA polymerase sigma-70 factor (ECF subfamily)
MTFVTTSILPAARLTLLPAGRTLDPPWTGAMGQSGRLEDAVPSAAAPAAPIARDAVRAALNELMDRYGRGEDEALEELYRLAAPRVRAFLLRLCADLTLADDLTQDAFLRICNARGQFVAGAPALPWMLAIARNALRDHYRREQVRRDNHADAMRFAVGPDGEASDEGGDRSLIAKQTLGAVQRALMKVPVRQREAFVLLRFEGLSVGEAAAVLGATQAAVKILVHRAYTAVRAALDENAEREGRGG